MKIAIIGAGFCGLAIAWYLFRQYPPFPVLKVHLFDFKGIGKGASNIAAGLLHPYTGAHAKLNWRGQEGLQATKELLEIASQALGHPVIANNNGILRLAVNDQQIIDFKKCSEKYPLDTQWVNSEVCQRLATGCIHVPGLWIKNGLTIYSSLYLQGLWQACAKQGAKLERHIVRSLKDLQDFDCTIVAAGAETCQLPELANLPLTPVKGQVLEFAWPRSIVPLSCSLNSHVYLLMNRRQTSCLVGATYEKGYHTASTDIEKAKREILPKAFEIFPPLKTASLINCYAGMRMVAPQHRPFLQRLSQSQWVLTGMGSKGLLYHALFAKELVQCIWKENVIAD